MNVLLDACVPRPLRRFLPSHTVRVAQEIGWGQLKNGVLLKEAELQFDAFITTDQNLSTSKRSSEENSPSWCFPPMTGPRFGLKPRKSPTQWQL